jgi:anti-sigma factor RsiW
MNHRENPSALPVIAEPPHRWWLDAFLATHPERRARVEELQRREREEREDAQAVVEAIYSHFAAGIPSRLALIRPKLVRQTESLRGWLSDIEIRCIEVARDAGRTFQQIAEVHRTAPPSGHRGMDGTSRLPP